MLMEYKINSSMISYISLGLVMSQTVELIAQFIVRLALILSLKIFNVI